MTMATALAGGIIIGLASALMHILLGRVAGISGIVGGTFISFALFIYPFLNMGRA